jgi:hypothetical protein
VVAEYVQMWAEALNCDVGFVLPHELPALGGLIGNKVVIELKPTWREPSVFWACTVGWSGTVKSPAKDAPFLPLRDLDAKLMADNETAKEEYQKKLALAKDEGGERPKKDPERHLLINDFTIEVVMQMLAENPRGLTVDVDEMAAFLSSFNQYRGHGSDGARWLEAHAARTWKRSRVGPNGVRETTFIPRANINISGTTQPDIFSRLMTAEMRASGMLARLLLSYPPAEKKVWTEKGGDKAVTAAYVELVEKLWKLPQLTQPAVVTLSPAAKDLFKEFYNEWNAETFGCPRDLAATFAKIECYAPRLALLHHVVSTLGTSSVVSDTSMEQGITLARWFGAEARRTLGLMDRVSTESELDELVNFIDKQPGKKVAVRGIQRRWPRRYPRSTDAENALGMLGDRLHWGAEATGGRPSTVVTLVR